MNFDRERLIELIVFAYDKDSLPEVVEKVTGKDMFVHWASRDDPFRKIVSDLVSQLRKEGYLARVLEEAMARRTGLRFIQIEFPAFISFLKIEAGEIPAGDPAAVPAPQAFVDAPPVPVAAALSGEDELLREWREKLDHIRIFKDLHDCLHHVQLDFAELEGMADQIGQSEESGAIRDFESLLEGFRSQGQEAKRTLEAFPQELGAEAEDERRWLEKYEAALKLADESIESADGKGARRAVMQFRRILRREPARIDAALGKLAGSLDLGALKEVLQAAASGSGDRPDLAAGYTELRQTADQLFRELKTLVEQHRQWQMMDLTLWEADDHLRLDPAKAEAFDPIWQDVGDFLRDLMAAAPGEEWRRIVKRKAATDAALREGSPVKLTIAFKEFRRSCLLAFYNMDGTLKVFSRGERVRDFLKKLPRSIKA